MGSSRPAVPAGTFPPNRRSHEQKNFRSSGAAAASLEANDGPRRRSLRKREGKSYAEFGEGDFIIEEDHSEPGSPLKSLSAGHERGGRDLRPNSHAANPLSSVALNSSATAPVSNGDVEMESDVDDDDDDGPLEPLPLPKVS